MEERLTALLRYIVNMIAVAHEELLAVNDERGFGLSDKALHFIVIGIIGILAISIVYPVFLYLAKRKHILTITAIYVTTLMLVLTFAIEIGQKVSGTGRMEFRDIVSGMAGFFFFFVIFACIRWMIKKVCSLFKVL